MVIRDLFYMRLEKRSEKRTSAGRRGKSFKFNQRTCVIDEPKHKLTNE